MADRILVFPCGSEVGLEIQRAFRGVKGVCLIGASSIDDHGAQVYENYVGDLPFVSDKRFGERFIETCRKRNVDYVFPAHDEVMLVLSRLLEGTQFVLIGSSAEVIRICRSKSLTYRTLSGVVRTPRIFNRKQISDSDFPLFLKPDKGQGSRGVHIARSFKELDFYLERNSDLLILEYLPGEEFTVDCFSDASGNLRFCGARSRDRIRMGIAVRTHRVPGDAFRPQAEAINTAIRPNGCWFFQVKQAVDGNPVLLEVAPRVAGSMALHRICGVNLPLLAYYRAKGIVCEILDNGPPAIMDRALDCGFALQLDYSDVYIDYDDCLVRDGGLDPELISFLVAAGNAGKRLHILSCHRGDLESELLNYGIRTWFDSIIHVQEGRSKADYIPEGEPAIFIDDSFSERAGVARARGIPVFAPDAVSALQSHPKSLSRSSLHAAGAIC